MTPIVLQSRKALLGMERAKNENEKAKWYSRAIQYRNVILDIIEALGITTVPLPSTMPAPSTKQEGI